MKYPYGCRAVVLCALLFTGYGVTTGLAHSPFDCSSRMVAQADRIELTTTMGLGGSKQFLLNAGLSPEAAAEALRTRAPYLHHDLPATVAGRLFEVKSGLGALITTNINCLSDGVEVVFKATYARPPTGTLEFRALYFNGVEQMKHGSFVATDERGHQLGAALLSRADTVVQIPLPAMTPTNATIRVLTAETQPPSTGNLPPK